MVNIDTIIFDVDGTLFQTDVYIYGLLNEILAEMELPSVEKEKVIKNIGIPSQAFYEELFGHYGEEMVKKIRARKNELYFDCIRKKGLLYKGVVELLDQLCEKGFKLGICSNGRFEYIDFLLKTFDLEKYFCVVKTYEENSSKTKMINEIKNELKVEELIFVGDRIIDFKAASNNGCVSIGMTYGYGGEEISYADYSAEDVEQLNALIEKICGTFAKVIKRKIVSDVYKK
jgi:phosphoglycolate phosphatase